MIKKYFKELLNKDLDSITFCAVDIEATGSKPEKNSIIEIAAVKFQNGKIIDNYSSFVRPLERIPFYVKKLTGITQSMTDGAPELDEILPQFVDFVQNTVIVGHDVDFDYSFISYKLKEIGLRGLDAPAICTLMLSWQLYPELKKRNLTFLSEYFNIPIENKHRALDDSLITADLLIRYIKLLKKNNINNLKDLIIFQKSRLFGPTANSFIKREFIINDIPEMQGIFSLKSVSGKTIHIEKSHDIKKRLSAVFFGDEKIIPPKTLSKLVNIKYFTSNSVEENDYIFEKYYRKYFPTDKILKNQLMYIKISRGKHLPRIYHTKYFNPDDTDNIFLGPFVHRRDCEKFIKLLISIYPFRRCNKNFTSYVGQKACGRCNKSCIGVCTRLEKTDQYIEIYHILKNFLTGQRISEGAHKSWLIKNISKSYSNLSLKKMKMLNTELKRYYQNIYKYLNGKYILKTMSMDNQYVFILINCHLIEYYKYSSDFNEKKI
ncbi:hypothetical protein KAJ27_04160, partial [bacterium]|nr:hypothetical protein [bacterium]